MRWERLFADLEARLEAEEHRELEADLADRVRAERGRLSLHDRLRAHVGERLTWSLVVGDAPLTGELVDVGVDWALLRSDRGELLLPVGAVESVSGFSRAADPVTGEVARRLRLTVLLRGLARDRAVLSIVLRSGRQVTGTIDRVGADHVDLAVHADDLLRRRGAVSEVRCLVLQAVVSIAVR